MVKLWVVVADSSMARIFSAESPMGALHEIHTMNHAESRQAEQALASDEPGRSFDRSGQGARHAMEPRTTIKEHEAQVFAKELATYLEQQRGHNNYDRLVISAAPGFLGLLRDKLGANSRKAVALEQDKNLVHMNAAEIRRHLPERLPAV